MFLPIQLRPQGLQNGDSEKTLANSRPPNRHFEYHEEAEDDVATYELEYFNKRIKDGAYYCYCAYVLRISRYSVFLWVVPANTGIFLRGLKLYGKSRT